MADIIGRNGKLYASTDGAAWTAVGGVFSVETAINNERIDATDFDSAGAKEGEYGEHSVTYTASFHRDEADAGQDIIRAAHQNKTVLYLRHRPEETAGADQIDSKVIPTSLNSTNARNALVDQALTAESSGTVTYSTQ